MNEKKVLKISLTTFFLILFIITAIIIIICIYIYKSNDSDKILENLQTVDDNIVLYNGYEIKPQTGIQFISNMNNTSEAQQKYNTTYYNYENGKYEGITEGNFGDENDFDNFSSVSNVKRIAMTKKYNAIPRNFSRIDRLAEKGIKIIIDKIDLDSDGKEEQIICYTCSADAENHMGKLVLADSNRKEIISEEFETHSPIAFSKIILLDSNEKKIADLVTLKEGFKSGIKEENNKIFLTLDKTEYIDIDNDGVMEIIIEIPSYKEKCIGIYKYNNGKIEGEINYMASVMP